MTFIAKIKEDRGLDFGSDYNLARFRQFCKDNVGKIVKIEQEVSTRTMSQNKLYWLYLGVIEFETGNNSEEMHEYFKRTLLPPKFIKIKTKNGEKEIKIPTSTTDLNKIQFSEYMDKICAETEIPIPDSEAYKAEMDLAPLK